MCTTSDAPSEWMTSCGYAALIAAKSPRSTRRRVRVVAALQHDLGGAELDGLAAAAQDLVESRVQPSSCLRRAVERAELARRDADVGVVDVAVDDVRRDVVRVPPAAYRVGGLAQRVQRRVGVEDRAPPRE